MGRALGNIIIILALIMGIAFVAAPWFAFRSLRDAARHQDSAALAGLIDYPAVRTNLGAQLHPSADQSPPPDIWHDPIGAITNAITPKAAPEDVDVFLTPKALAALTDGRPLGAGPVTAQQHEPFPMVRYWGPNRCRIGVVDPDKPGRETEFTFERKGLYNFYTWKLTEITLPKKKPAPHPAAAPAPAPAAPAPGPAH